uniref:Uncharacterized protein n=1 Tax=Zea mays TaxID=4577 RepID=A0A804LPU8_MAIZE
MPTLLRGDGLVKLLHEPCEPVDVYDDMLSVDEDVPHLVESLVMYGERVRKDGVVAGVGLLQRGLLRRGLVVEIAESHVWHRVSVRMPARPPELAPRDDLHHRGVVRQEEHVGQPSAVHAHEHVAGVNHPGKALQVTDVVWSRSHHLEADTGRGGDGVGLVLELPRVAPQDHDEPRLPPGCAPAHGCHPCPLQRVGGADEVPEADHRVAVAGESRDDAQLLVALQPDMGRLEAAHGVLGVHVDDWVAGQCGEDGLVLGDPLGLVVGGKQLDVAVVLSGRQVEWDDHVGHDVEEVPVVSAGRENHGWHVVPNRALRWWWVVGTTAACWWRTGTHGDLANQQHHLLLPLACIRAELDRRIFRTVGGRRDDVYSCGFAMDAHVAFHGARVRLMVAQVAD